MKYMMFFVLLLSACAGTPSIDVTQPPVSVSKTSKFESAGLTGFHSTTVRSFLVVEGKNKEASNISCKLSGAGFVATFVTPAKVNLPIYGPNTRPITVKCDSEGITGSVSVEPFNITEANAPQTGGATATYGLSPAGMIVGLLVGVAVDAAIDAAVDARDKSADKFGYRNIGVVLE